MPPVVVKRRLVLTGQESRIQGSRWRWRRYTVRSGLVWLYFARAVGGLQGLGQVRSPPSYRRSARSLLPLAPEAGDPL